MLTQAICKRVVNPCNSLAKCWITCPLLGGNLTMERADRAILEISSRNDVHREKVTPCCSKALAKTVDVQDGALCRQNRLGRRTLDQTAMFVGGFGVWFFCLFVFCFFVFFGGVIFGRSIGKKSHSSSYHLHLSCCVGDREPSVSVWLSFGVLFSGSGSYPCLKLRERELLLLLLFTEGL